MARAAMRGRNGVPGEGDVAVPAGESLSKNDF